MTGRLAGKVALVTGAASGIGRATAVRMAEEGADIIVMDIAHSKAGLAETAAEVAALGRRVSEHCADVRIATELETAIHAGIAAMGGLDIVCASAGVFAPIRPSWEFDEDHWDLMNDVNAKGTWLTCRIVIPYLIEQKKGGSIIFINSVAGLIAVPGGAAYSASKHANVGLMRALALEAGRHNIRVNTIHPGLVATPMVMNDATFKSLRPELEAPAKEDAAEVFRQMFSMPIDWIEPRDVANAVLFLASDEARYITATQLKIDAGYSEN